MIERHISITRLPSHLDSSFHSFACFVETTVKHGVRVYIAGHKQADDELLLVQCNANDFIAMRDYTSKRNRGRLINIVIQNGGQVVTDSSQLMAFGSLLLSYSELSNQMITI